jgi:anti-sigma factor RsiW
VIRRWLAHRRYMREHHYAAEHYSAYLDDDLSPAEKARVEAHVGICPECTKVLAALRRTLEGLRGLRDVEAPGVADSVIDRLRGQT